MSEDVKEAIHICKDNAGVRIIIVTGDTPGTANEIGRQIGFPTANLKVNGLKLIPSDGVYVVDVEVEGVEYRGVLNIGSRPTVSGDERTIEVHIIGFIGDLYGKEVELKFLKFLRHEQRFSSLDDLREQIRKDFNQASIL